MDIATIQKRKFLNNIYRLMYSKGTKPSEQEVRKEFAKYFSANRPGSPVRLDYNRISLSNTTDVDVLNELMITGLLNLEVLYDSVFENNEQLFSIVTAMNNRLNGLRARRKELEAKVDQLLFANANSDGFYYSYLEDFANTSNIDLSMTSAYVDLTNGNVTIPKITNAVSDSIVNKDIFFANATLTAKMNEATIVEDVPTENFDLTLDGLTDTYWNYDIRSEQLGIASVSLTIPVDSAFSISKIDGALLTTSPCSVFIKAVPIISSREPVVKVQESTGDYSRFSFVIPADVYSSVVLTIFKVEPDRLESASTGMYVYSFGIRELAIGSSYYDTRGTIVSAPIQIPSEDNSHLAISTVSIDAKAQVLPGTNIQYYVAADTGGTDISSFNWIKIDPSNEEGVQNVVNLSAGNSMTKTIDSTNSSLTLIPDLYISGDLSNLNELNPSTLPYSERVVYRVCAVDPSEKFIEPVIFAGVSRYRLYSILTPEAKIETETYKSLDYWKGRITNASGVNTDILSGQVTSVSPGIFTSSVGMLETNISCDSPKTAVHTVTKSSADFNLGIYLNGVMIGDLPKGVVNKSIEWNFLSGVNTVQITYDKNFSGLFTFNLMTGKALDEYGTVFLDYFTYLDPIAFRSTRLDLGNTFTIDATQGRTEILSTKKIAYRSILKYYNNTSDLTTAVRYRADLSRFDNPLQSPVLDAIRVKFKHNDTSI